METRSDIAGSELVTRVFGYWPSFHDAEVVRMSLETRKPYADGPVLRADIYAFEITNDIGPDGALVLRHHSLVSLLFSGIDSLRLERFGNHNTLMGLNIIDIRSRQLESLKFEVTFDGSFSVGFLSTAHSAWGFSAATFPSNACARGSPSAMVRPDKTLQLTISPGGPLRVSRER